MEICILKPLKLCWSLAEGSTVWGRQHHERIHLGQLRTPQQLVINSTSITATMLEGIWHFETHTLGSLAEYQPAAKHPYRQLTPRHLCY